jgi:AraC family transcriptional regulator, regulatory protein of adaptative response / methylated-DNA-[protein]-cysteine methyltransferase
MNTMSRSYLRYASGQVGQLHIVTASYSSRGRGTRIAYTIAPWEFDSILLAATSQGICWLGIHRSATHLESELRKDLSQAVIVRDDCAMRTMIEPIIAFVNGASASLDLPLDIRATPFQLAVWRELCAIPPGTTRSYGEIARQLGRPGSARAVGRANGSNPLAVLIPCHRAVGTDGKLTGYRWGVEYKRRLLENERRSFSSPSIHHQL